MENKSNLTVCYKAWQYFHEPGIDLTVLKLAFIATAVLILASNGLLLRKLLLKREKTRADKLFIILSLSDMGIGACTIPMLSLLTFSLKRDIVCLLHPVTTFFTYYPYLFSWAMVIIIAIDRCLMITKSNTYGKYITNKFLYLFIGLVFLAITCVTAIVIPKGKYKLYSRKISAAFMFQIFMQLLSIFTVAALYSYLLYYVRKKAKRFDNNRRRHSQQIYSEQVTKSIFLIYLCLIFFSLPHAVGLLVWLSNPPATPSNVTVRNRFCWLVLSLYSNSYVNAMILIYRTRKQRILPQSHHK